MNFPCFYHSAKSLSFDRHTQIQIQKEKILIKNSSITKMPIFCIQIVADDTSSLRSMASSGMPDFTRRPFSRSSSKGGVGGGGASTTSSRPPSAFENNIDYFREPVVKSPPEPTRVKSPESVVRSPDPINWTVPLDTGKTFSVSQSIKDGGKLFA